MPPTTLAANHEGQDGTVKILASGSAHLLAGLLIAFNLVVFMLVQRDNANLEKGDFKMFYSAAVALRSGHSAELYSRDFYVPFQRQLFPSLPLQDVKVYTHPPFELLVFLPLSYLSYKAACYSWLAITLLLAVACGRSLPGYAAVLALFPLLATMLEQQDSVLSLLIVIGLLACPPPRALWVGRFFSWIGSFQISVHPSSCLDTDVLEAEAAERLRCFCDDRFFGIAGDDWPDRPSVLHGIPVRHGARFGDGCKSHVQG